MGEVNFVFDGRTAVTHGVEEGREHQITCMWLAFNQRKKPNCQAMNHVSCVFCGDKTTENRKRFRMRQSQIAANKNVYKY